MFSIAQLLDRAKVQANIESDYRLAKVLQIKQSAISNYRTGRNLPNVEIIEALCALTGDDAGLMVALAEAERAKDGPVKRMWEGMARRLQHGAASVSGVVALVMAAAIFATLFVADDAYAEAPTALQQFLTTDQSVYYV